MNSFDLAQYAYDNACDERLERSMALGDAVEKAFERFYDSKQREPEDVTSAFVDTIETMTSCQARQSLALVTLLRNVLIHGNEQARADAREALEIFEEAAKDRLAEVYAAEKP